MSDICPCPNCKSGSGKALPVAALLTVAGAAFAWHEIHQHAGQITHAAELAAITVVTVVVLVAGCAGALAWHLTRRRPRQVTTWRARHVEGVRPRPGAQLGARRGRGEVTPPARLSLSQAAGRVPSQVNGLPVTLAEDLSHVVIPGQVVSTNDE